MHRAHLSIALVLLLMVSLPVFAGHSWGTYHWSKTSSAALNLPIHDNVDSRWDGYLVEAHTDWNQSTQLNNTLLVNSPLSNVKRCTSATGKIEVCNARYGQNGWLGIAGISISGGHITKGYTKLNDTYFDTARYNTPAWRRMVTCQEIGHDFGLDHQDEAFGNTNLGTCMDYTNAPAGGVYNGVNYGPSNEHPNKHDYDQLVSIYGHTHAAAALPFDAMVTTNSRARTIEELLAGADQWGAPVRFDPLGRPNLFKLRLGVDHEGNEDAILTHVFWAPEDPFSDRDDRRGAGREK